jgi:hypothetical protein
MIYGILADLVLVGHAAFTLFVVGGALVVVRWKSVAWIHLPCAAWGALVELAGWVCPLTPLEIALRRQAYGTAYEGGFLEHYVVLILYPPGLTRGIQMTLGLGVIVLNVALYAWAWRRHRALERPDP